MKLLYTLFFFFLFFGGTLEAANPSPGYIVTKNGKRLTGYIGELLNFSYESIVVFINDFGTVYNIEAQRIRGFAFQDEEGFKAFESKYFGSRWFYLRIIEKGKAINLYQSPEEQHFLEVQNGALRVGSQQLMEFWLEVKGQKQPMRITSYNFRRKMRRLFKKEYPEIWEKVDDRRYQLQHLPEIVHDYNYRYYTPKYNL